MSPTPKTAENGSRTERAGDFAGNPAKLSEQDAVDIFANALLILRESGIDVRVKNIPQNAEIPAGLVVFCGNVHRVANGFIFAVEQGETK